MNVIEIYCVVFQINLLIWNFVSILNQTSFPNFCPFTQRGIMLEILFYWVNGLCRYSVCLDKFLSSSVASVFPQFVEAFFFLRHLFSFKLNLAQMGDFIAFVSKFHFRIVSGCS